MPQVEQTLPNSRSGTSSMTLSMMRAQNAAVTHPYAHVQQREHTPSAPRKHRSSPPSNHRTAKSNVNTDTSSAGPGPIRHPLARSQGPVPTTTCLLRDAPSHSGSQQHLSSAQPKPQYQVTYANQVQAHTPLHSVDQAFTVYADRVHSSLNEFRAVCTTLVAHEQEERRRVHALCLKVMRERDLAKQRFNALITKPDTSADLNKRLQRKRSREEGIIAPVPAPATTQGGRATSSSPKVFFETSLSPVLSPDVSPHDLPSPLSPALGRPVSGFSPAGSSLSPPFGHASRSLSPLDIPFPSGSDHTLVESTPPMKRRKSYEACTTVSSSSSVTCVDVPKPEIPKPAPAASLKTEKGRAVGSNTNGSSTITPGNFAHVDLMYIPSKAREGGLVCRACLLESTKSRLSTPSPLCLEPVSSLPSPTSPPTASPQSKSRAMSKPEVPAISNFAKVFEPTSFPPGTPWHELQDHCVRAHPRECEDVNRLHPAQVWELRRRLGVR